MDAPTCKAECAQSPKDCGSLNGSIKQLVDTMAELQDIFSIFRL